MTTPQEDIDAAACRLRTSAASRTILPGWADIDASVENGIAGVLAEEQRILTPATSSHGCGEKEVERTGSRRKRGVAHREVAVDQLVTKRPADASR
jgi:hypothetical protein